MSDDTDLRNASVRLRTELAAIPERSSGHDPLLLHLRRDRTLIEDEEGGEFDGFAEARAEAVMAAGGLVTNSIRTGQAIDGDRVEIWTEGEGLIGAVRLHDVIPLRALLDDAE